MATKTPTPAEQSRQNLDEARQTLHDRRTDLAEISSEIETVQRAWKAGRDETPASRLTELKDEQTRLTSLVSAAERQVKSAERRLLTDNPELAEAIAYALGSKFYGITAEAVTTLPEIDSDDLQPHLYIIQSKPHRDSGSGSVSGECSIRLVGPAWTRPLEEAWLKHTLHSAGVRWTGPMSVTKGSVDLEITYAYPRIPTVLTVPERRGETVSVNTLTTVVEKESVDGRGTELAAASAPSGEIVSVKVDADGVRTTVVETGLTIHNNPRGYWSADQAVDQAKKQLSGLRNEPLGGLGRVAEVEHVSVGVTEPTLTAGPGRRITSRITTVSKVRPAH